MRWELVLGLVTLLVLLVCPLHMWWMMRHMSRGESRGKRPIVEGDGSNLAVAPTDVAEQEIRLLKERITRLETERRHAHELWK